MRSSLRGSTAVVALMLGWVACADPKSEEPSATPDDPTLAIEGFDVAEAGWGDAPLPVHFIWSIKSATGRISCKLDWDGDGTFDQELPNCRLDTTNDAPAELPTFTFSKMGEYHPKLVVSAGARTVEATTTIYANHVDFAPGVVFPEKAPGFVSATLTWTDPRNYGVLPPDVALTYSDASKLPTIAPGTIVWGTTDIGYLMKVKSATASGAKLTLTGEPVQLAEAIENGFVGARDIVPSYDGLRCASAECAGAVFEKLATPLPAIDAGAPSSGKKALGTQRWPLIIEGKGSFGAKVKLPSPTKNFEHTLFVGMKINKFLVEIGFFKLKRFTIDTAPAAKYEFSVQASLASGFANLGTIPFAPVPIPPLYVVPALVPEVRWDLKVKASASMEVVVPFNAQYDSSKGEDWTWSVSPNSVAEVLGDTTFGPEVSVGAQGKVSFVPKFEALVMGLGGPYIAPALSVTGELKLKTPPPSAPVCDSPTGLLGCLSFKASVAGEGGLDAPWLANAGKALSAAYKGPIKFFDVTIAEAQFFEKCLGKCDDAGVSDAGDDATLVDSTVVDTSVSDTAVADTTIVTDTGSDGGVDLSGITTECFEGMVLEVPGTHLYGPATMRVTNVQEVKGGISAYSSYLATPEVGDQSTKVPPSAKVFTFGDPADTSGVPGFPSPVASRNINRYGRSNLIAVWLNETTGAYEWMFNVTAGHYSISGGSSATYRQFQFIYDTRATPQYVFKTYGSTTGTSWSQVTASSIDTGSGISATATRPKECFKLPELRLSPIATDFGAIGAGGSSSDAIFTLSNVGAAGTSPLSIVLGGADASLFTISGGTCGSGASLAASSSCTINVKLAPSSSAAAGAKSATINATASLAGSAIGALSGRVTTGGITIAPTPHAFGWVLGGIATSDATFTVSNTGTVPTSAITVSLIGSDAASFAITGGTCASGVTTLAPSGSCTVTARFQPSAAAFYGGKAATLQAVATTGGTASAALTGGVLAPPGLIITPTPKSFGSVATGAVSDEVSFTLKNGIGAATTGTISLSLSGTDPTQFTITGGTCVSGTTKLAGGEQCTILARFKPTTAGAKSATLQAAAAPGGTVWAAISGTGL